MAEAFVLEEVTNFTQAYYGAKLPSVHNRPPRYNAGENESKPSLFQGQLGSASDATSLLLKNEDWLTIIIYVFTNLTEMEPYMQ